MNAPVDTWLTFANSNYSSSITPGDGTDISARVRADVFSQSVILTRTMDFGGRTGGLSVIAPYVDARASAAGARMSNRGMSDLGLMWQMNLFGGPALTREQFRHFVPQTFSSVHLIVLAPTGKYDAANPINPGSNRWTLYPTVNYSYTPDQGWTWLELYLSAKFFTRNRDFGFAGGTLSQKPLYLAELHASRNLTPKLWVSADAYYGVGGETRINGIGQDNAANTLRLGVGTGFHVWQGGQMMLNYEQVVAKPAGQPDAWTFRLKIQQIW
ncbi:transporter [Bordetella petrii]|uniref:transporter n=1 Tax=Bordetella petrii TaxID=94624 RepID=UPI001E3A700F|nr:transporter [Bordetella petrii]MCD0502432.1 transporter [Bordetella petrii]